MGKIKKNRLSGRGDTFRSSETLPTQIAREMYADQNSDAKCKDKTKTQEDDPSEQILDESISLKILQEARKQKEELEDEFPTTSSKLSSLPSFSLDDFPSLTEAADFPNNDEDANGDDDASDELEINEEDAKAFEKFMPSADTKLRTLADVISDKIAERRTELTSKLSDAGSLQYQDMDPRLMEMFQGVGKVLSKYRSGRLPKPFKIIPKMANWEQIMLLTEPDNWTAAAMLQATRLFVSNLDAKMCQRFLNLVLLPRIRDDIEQYKKLNPHLYQALKKGLFKPGAFFKGFLLPLCESGTCTLREATVIGSVLSNCSVPMLHTAAAMLRIAEMDYSGANSLFLRILIAKKYALPYRVIDGLVHHFLRFTLDKRELPVLWHQALLALAVNYKADISNEQKEALLELIRAKSHYKITPDIRYQLVNSKCRDEDTDDIMGDTGSRTIQVPDTGNPDAF